MSGVSELVLCYNRGCGQSFDPSKNTAESCRHHPGTPVFHDAYKGWSCCSKKSTDFTEFLNIKGCTVSYHNNEKPPEPEKPKKEVLEDVIEYHPPPISTVQEVRVPFDTPMILMKYEIAQSLKNELDKLKASNESHSGNLVDPSNIPIGTPCTNNSCKAVFEGPESLKSKCTHHPGCPVFHEGLKFWSCCTKRTTDFNAFLEQVGCKTGNHVWFKKQSEDEAKCRLDWHQTGSDVFVTIYGKTCDPYNSSVHLSPVRLKISLHFPQQGAYFNRDLHLRRVINVDKSTVNYYGSKIEIKLGKSEPGSWTNLEFPSDKPTDIAKNKIEEEKPPSRPITEISERVESVDLSCL